MHELANGRRVQGRQLELHRRILDSTGHPVAPGSRVLDFGCGAGAMVEEYLRAGYAAYGCDIALERPDPRLHLIETGPYRLPFDDEGFDLVYSDQVLEHVEDHRAAVDEIWRVLKPGGTSLHIFPSKFIPIEPHVRVPLAGVVQAKAWLWLWALLGVRNEYQAGKRPAEVASINRRYLRDSTHYLSKRELVGALERRFDDVQFAERWMIEHSYGGARRLRPLVRPLPRLASVYSSFYSRVIVLSKSPSGAR